VRTNEKSQLHPDTHVHVFTPHITAGSEESEAEGTPRLAHERRALVISESPYHARPLFASLSPQLRPSTVSLLPASLPLV